MVFIRTEVVGNRNVRSLHCLARASKIDSSSTVQVCHWPKRLLFFLSPAAHVLIEKTVSEAVLVIMLQVGQQHMRIILNTVHQCKMIGPG